MQKPVHGPPFRHGPFLPPLLNLLFAKFGPHFRPVWAAAAELSLKAVFKAAFLLVSRLLGFLSFGAGSGTARHWKYARSVESEPESSANASCSPRMCRL
jgi:hypothetical protein